MLPKYADGMAITVDPDQTAPLGTLRDVRNLTCQLPLDYKTVKTVVFSKNIIL